MSKHSPGNWRVDRSLNNGPRLVPNGHGLMEFRIEAPLGNLFQYVATIQGMSLNSIDEANADLIAAAPQLLEACKLSLAYLRASGFKDGDAYPSLIKAIAKAEGKITLA